MRIAVSTWLVVVTLCVSWSHAEDADVLQRPQVLAGKSMGVGRLVPDLSFVDLDGKPGKLSDYDEFKALVIAFTNVGCPVCKKYGPRLAALPTSLGKDVAVLLVNPSPQDTDEAIETAVQAYGFTSRYVPDRDNAIAKALTATTTAEVFVLDGSRTLVYRGAVDDQYGVGYAHDRPRRRYLEEAVAATLRGERPSIEATTAPGCLLDFEKPTVTDTEITYHEHVSRIVERHCVECHRKGENGPFPLRSYRDVKGNASMIRFMVEEDRMPPAFEGKGSLPIGNSRKLAPLDKQRLLAWIDAGMPQGPKDAAPVPRTFVKGWKIGKPDAVVELPRAFPVPADGVVKYQYFDVETDFGEDRWVKAMEVRPTAPEVVHHALVFVRYPTSHPRRSDQPRVRGGLAGYFAAMVPGQSAFTFPTGTARFLPKGATLRFQLHYTPNGKAVKDRTRLGLIFAPGEPEHEIRSAGAYSTKFLIPPGAANHPVSGTRFFPQRVRIFGFTPHMHLRGKAFRYELIRPDGTVSLLLDVPRYDFNWQLFYQLREPLDLPAGCRIKATGWFDNSEGNPANPDPTRAVHFGEQTFDEMMIGYIDWHPLR